MERALTHARDFTGHVTAARVHASATDVLQTLDTLVPGPARDDSDTRTLENALINVRRLLNSTSMRESRVAETIAVDLVANIEKLSGTLLKAMNDYEQEQIRHILREAAAKSRRVW
jgi:hypothetical protein